MIETIILFMRTTKQKLWGLHLAAFDRFSPYFFALDLGYYARIIPVYLSSMYSLRKDDRETWNFISSNFCCNKTKAPFVAIGVHHCPDKWTINSKTWEALLGCQTMKLTSIVWQVQLNDSYWRSLKNRSDLPRLLLIVITFTKIGGHISSSIQFG